MVMRQRKPTFKGWWRNLTLLHLFILIAVTVIPALQAASIMESTPGPSRYRPDRILIQPKPGRHGPALASLHSRHGATVWRTFASLDHLQVIQLPAGVPVAEALALYESSGDVEFAEPDYWVQASLEPNDPEYIRQALWGLNNVGQNGGVPDIDIDAPEGWGLRNSASNIIVAVIDSGVEYQHADLSANMWVNAGALSAIVADEDQNGFATDVYGINAINRSGDPADDYGHGTLLAGIIGAVGNNHLGVVGVAWQVRIMACKFLDNQGHGSISDAIACMDYARQNGAQIINASWNNSDYSQSLRSAILRLRQDGIILVASAGNGGQDSDTHPSYPCGYEVDNIVTVTAIDRNGFLPPTANYGATSVDLAAPGADIYSTWHGPGTIYASASGTSMAAAYVTGSFAVVKAHFPHEDYRQLINRVMSATKPLPAMQGKCLTGGMASLKNALGSSLIAHFEPSAKTGAVPLAVVFTNLSTGDMSGLTWDFGDGSPLSQEIHPQHLFLKEGQCTVTLTVTSKNGSSNTHSQVISAIANYQIEAANFSWVEPEDMAAVILDNDGVSPALPMPFPFIFFNQSYEQVYVGANGLLGFLRPGMEIRPHGTLPNLEPPQAIICPYWDALIPMHPGAIRFGAMGNAPNRSAVITWTEVRRDLTPEVALTFQAILEEASRQIKFQYREVQPEAWNGGGRPTAIGVENETGVVASLFGGQSVAASPTNHQAILFRPTSAGGLVVSPVSPLAAWGTTGGPFALDHTALVLRNSARYNLSWNVTHEQNWLSLSATNGTLNPSETCTVTCAINTNAATLIMGEYRDPLRFRISGDGLGDCTRTVILSVRLPQPTKLVPLSLPSPGQLAWRLSGNPGASFRWDYSTNLLSWFPFQTNSLPANGTWDFTDTQAGHFNQRFFRVVPTPDSPEH